MRVLAIVHERDAGPGVFADAAREHGAELAEWHIAEGERPPDAPARYDAVLSLGGSMHPHEGDRYTWIADEVALLGELATSGHPVFAVCLGAQLLARASGGTTYRMIEPEIGWYRVRLTAAGTRDSVLGPLAADFTALQWHSCAARPGTGAAELAQSPRCTQAFRAGSRAWGIQFHAEITLGDFERWLAGHLSATAAGDGPADPGAFLTETRTRIDAWSALGRGLFDRFLDTARDPAGGLTGP